MDKSVAQKFMIVMSMLTAMFATVFVCGSIVSSSVSTDGYLQPVPKTHFVVTYSDTSIYETPNETVSQSDVDKQDNGSAVPTTTGNPSVVENGVTVVEFVDDDDEDYTSETSNVPEEDIDNQFLYMTTVTTKLPDANLKESATTTTVKRTTTTVTRKTTKKPAAVTAAKPFTTKAAATTTRKKTTTTFKPTTTKAIKTTTTQKPTQPTVTTMSTTTASKTTASTTTSKVTTTTTASTTKATTTASSTKTTTTAAETQPTTKRTTTAAPVTTTTTKAPQIGGAVSINKRTTTEGTEAGGQP